MRPMIAHCNLSLGALLCKTGLRDDARACILAAIKSYRTLGMNRWLPSAEAVLADAIRGHSTFFENK